MYCIPAHPTLYVSCSVGVATRSATHPLVPHLTNSFSARSLNLCSSFSLFLLSLPTKTCLNNPAAAAFCPSLTLTLNAVSPPSTVLQFSSEAVTYSASKRATDHVIDELPSDSTANAPRMGEG